MLMVTQSAGFRHKPVRRVKQEFCTAELTMRELADRSKRFHVQCTQDVATDFTKENLKNFDIVCLYTSGNLPIGDDHLDYFLNNWLTEAGHGLIGFHSATDTYKKKRVYYETIGATFDSHPWGQNSRITLTVHEADHPTMEPFGEEFDFIDEIYQYQNWNPQNVQVLMSLNMEKTRTKRPYHVPVAWVKQVGDGRLFYTNLGHRKETWHDERFHQSILNAIAWIRSKDHPVKPNPEVSAEQQSLSEEYAKEAGITLETLKAQRAQRTALRQAKQAARAKAKRPANNQQ